jgi:hypothetical protein
LGDPLQQLNQNCLDRLLSWKLPCYLCCMTIPEFFEDLRSTRDLFVWRYQGGSKSIRGFLKTGTANDLFDPLRAVGLIRTNTVFDEAHLADACRMIGLPSSESCDILDASNNYLLKTGESSGDVYKEWLRRQLVFAVALQNSNYSQGRNKMLSPV